MPHSGRPFSVRAALQTLWDGTAAAASPGRQRRAFHDYFVTHLPSSSLAPDRPSQHHYPRDASQPHSGPTRSAAHISPPGPHVHLHPPPSTRHRDRDRDMTIVRIPIRGAKHHFGASVSRGSRPYQEDAYQAGTIDIPAFARRQPRSHDGSARKIAAAGAGAARGVQSESGDPQVFYFGVFDGHGGSECSDFLRERLHGYVEEAALVFGMESSLRNEPASHAAAAAAAALPSEGGVMGEQDAEDLQRSLVDMWKETVGGYFKRFKPEHFPALATRPPDARSAAHNSSIEAVLTYAFLKADLDFTVAQATKHKEGQDGPSTQTSSVDDPVLGDRPLNNDDMLFHPDRPASQNLRRRRPSASPDLKAPIGGSKRFQGGSTASIALISTPTATPFWHPASPSTLTAAHVGDTRILLCRTSDGKAVPLTTDHHPDAPTEEARLRRYAATFATDSFGEARMGGLANTRAFGDVSSKRVGVSAEPQIATAQLPPAEFSFLVLVSDGVSGHLPDQEIVDVVKEARTPAQASEDVTRFAVEVAPERADNATCLVVRLGGWERRSEGGGGSLGTREQREFRREEAMDPRRRRQ